MAIVMRYWYIIISIDASIVQTFTYNVVYIESFNAFCDIFLNYSAPLIHNIIIIFLYFISAHKIRTTKLIVSAYAFILILCVCFGTRIKFHILIQYVKKSICDTAVCEFMLRFFLIAFS